MQSLIHDSRTVDYVVAPEPKCFHYERAVFDKFTQFCPEQFPECNHFINRQEKIQNQKYEIGLCSNVKTLEL